MVKIIICIGLKNREEMIQIRIIDYLEVVENIDHFVALLEEN